MKLDKFSEELNAHQKVKANPVVKVSGFFETSANVIEVQFNNETGEIEIIV